MEGEESWVTENVRRGFTRETDGEREREGERGGGKGESRGGRNSGMVNESPRIASVEGKANHIIDTVREKEETVLTSAACVYVDRWPWSYCSRWHC